MRDQTKQAESTCESCGNEAYKEGLLCEKCLDDVVGMILKLGEK